MKSKSIVYNVNSWRIGRYQVLNIIVDQVEEVLRDGGHPKNVGSFVIRVSDSLEIEPENPPTPESPRAVSWYTVLIVAAVSLLLGMVNYSAGRNAGMRDVLTQITGEGVKPCNPTPLQPSPESMQKP